MKPVVLLWAAEDLTTSTTCTFWEALLLLLLDAVSTMKEKQLQKKTKDTHFLYHKRFWKTTQKYLSPHEEPKHNTRGQRLTLWRNRTNGLRNNITMDLSPKESLHLETTVAQSEPPIYWFRQNWLPNKEVGIYKHGRMQLWRKSDHGPPTDLQPAGHTVHYGRHLLSY